MTYSHGKEMQSWLTTTFCYIRLQHCGITLLLDQVVYNIQVTITTKLLNTTVLHCVRVITGTCMLHAKESILCRPID